VQSFDCLFLSNISAKYYENPAMPSGVIAKNIGDVFLRHSVDEEIRLADKSLLDRLGDLRLKCMNCT